MEHGPSVEDLIHSIHQDVFNQEDNYSPMYGNSPVSTNQYPQNGLWNVPAVTNSDFQSGNQMLHQDVNFQTDRPQTPYFTPHSSQVAVHSPGATLQNRLQPQSNFTTTVHEEVTFTPPLSTTSQQNGGILYNPGVRSAESAVTSQPSSPRDGQFAPQPPLEPRKSKTRSSIRRAAKLLLNRSKQVLSNSDSNISLPSSSTPVPPGKDSKKNAGSPSVKERLNKNRARMGELLKNSKWKEKRQSSEEKENRYAINSKDSVAVFKPRQKARVRHVNDHRRFHSAENINASVLSSDSSHYSGSDVNDCSSNYMDDVSFDGNSGGAGYALRRYNSGPIQQERQRQRDHHRGYHTADSDTDSSISRGDLHYMAVQNRFGSGRQVKSTREALKKLNRNRSFNGQHSQQLGGTPKHTPAGPLKADHTIQPFIHNDRLQDSCLQDQWKEQGARPKFSSTESLETESVNHEVFPDTAIRSDSEDHRGSRSSLVGRHSRTASPCRSVHFEDEEVRRSTNGDLRKSASFNSDYDRTLTENEGLVSDYVRYGRRHSENGGCLRDRGTVMLHDGSVGDVFINGGTDSDAMDHVQRHRGHTRERSERSSRRSQSMNGYDHRNIGSGKGAMDNGYEISSTKGGRYDNNSGANSSGVGRKDRSNSEVREDGISIREEGDQNGRVDLRTPRSRSPFVKSISHDGHYPSEGGHVHLGSGGVTEEVANGDKIQNDNLDQLQGAIEPEYEEIKRAKKTYSTHANSYYDAIQAHSAWDEYKRKLQEEKDEEKRRAGPFADMSSFSRNQDHLSKMSGSNLSIASNSSISEKMQHLGHATKQTFGRMRRALSLDKINRNSQKDDGFDKGSKLKRSPSLRSMSSFFGRKKDKLMGSFSDLSTRERRSASISGPSSAVMEQIDVTTPSYMRKIGRVLEVYDDGTRLVRLVKPPNGPFGFYIAKGASTNGPGIFVKRIGDGHPAKILAGLLQVGDEILEINGHNVKMEKNIDTVYDLILDNDDLVLRVRPLIRRGTELS